MSTIIKMKLKEKWITYAMAMLATCGLLQQTEAKTPEDVEMHKAVTTTVPIEGLTEGVSRDLAVRRTAMVADVTYDLTFRLPEDKNEAVSGRAVIGFDYRGSESDKALQLDFKGKKYTGECVVNGKKRKADWFDEHILIPANLLLPGRNTVEISFESADVSLNRNDEYLYTLFVPANARSAFPCFDQPDMKARFRLQLDMPKTWKAISTGRILHSTGGRVSFAQTEPLPTYLFSFTAGRFHEKKAVRDGREISCLYRETAPGKVAQLDTVMNEVAFSLRWLEQYTGIKMPFSKYGFAVIPGYQFGGMEHPGAIQFNDHSIFLGDNPTPDERLRRLQLVAHETSHLWFGDLVTMRWFDDVWTKEVFANYMASKMAKEVFPDVDQDLDFLKNYQMPALATDRTDGTHPIQQTLGNLNQAGLLYGNIIYYKAPVMMRKLEEKMGAEAFRNGLRKYLKTYAYGNATWDGLIDILDKEAPDARLKEFSEVWVKRSGMPVITVDLEDSVLRVKQKDPAGRGLVWPQTFEVAVAWSQSAHSVAPSSIDVVKVTMDKDEVVIPLSVTEDRRPLLVVPNWNGQGYGRFRVNGRNAEAIEHLWPTWDGVNRLAAVMTLYENYWMGVDDVSSLYHSLFLGLEQETNPLVASACCSCMMTILERMSLSQRETFENEVYRLGLRHELPSVRQNIMRRLSVGMRSSRLASIFHKIWSEQSDTLLDERDYMAMSYRLALLFPTQWKTIVHKQRSRLTSEDRRREFDFVSRACDPNVVVQDSLFQSLAKVENRRIEPWTARMLSLLNNGMREPYNIKYVLPGLEMLEDVQRTGDIFFPSDWLRALLGDHRSAEARNKVMRFLANHPDYPLFLRNKLLEAAFPLMQTSMGGSKWHDVKLKFGIKI